MLCSTYRRLDFSVERVTIDKNHIWRPSDSIAYLPQPDAAAYIRITVYVLIQHIVSWKFECHLVAEYRMLFLLLGHLLSRIPNRLQGI